jgi:hypothetical protein
MKEEEIRPREIFDEYLRLAQQDTEEYFTKVRLPLACPACGTTGEPAFEKQGFAYESCPECLTLFVSPRPPAEAFTKYYTESPSARFWATTFYRETAVARREKLWKPRAKMVLEALTRCDANGHSIIDIGGGFGLFAEEIRALTGRSVAVIEPGPPLASACRQRGLTVIEKFLEEVASADLPQGPRAFVSFELLEHLHEPAAFITHIGRLMSSGDLFLFTTLSGTGLDIQVLWQNSKSVSPPHHLNFFNPRSISLLLKRLEFDVIEVKTPGKLDIDILANSRELIRDRFWTTFLALTDETTRQRWQSLIADSGWSSHMLAICRKP